ncbi:competence protein ComK [Neobacillus sp. OS1-32]|uniref:competence protein ComK n=1 Tax=Neobacillus sp. OS1-32 TaxID=3070682 RepID=UPI0027E126C3|nr:competence protein ComK [Neobacillus sp. OS1-32]WML29647.1 competence protein ComK [Neobacillus sp. OS1-32]
MNSKKFYFIKPEFMYMAGFYDRYGNRFSVVHEVHRTLIVERSPIEILADSIRRIGFDLRGAIATAKSLLGDIQMCPIMVNPIHQICVFPTKSAKNDDTIWFNPNQIIRTKCCCQKTLVLLGNGRSILVPNKLSSFNTKLQNADQLKKITTEFRNNPVTFTIEPKHDRLDFITKRVQKRKKIHPQSEGPGKIHRPSSCGCLVWYLL